MKTESKVFLRRKKAFMIRDILSNQPPDDGEAAERDVNATTSSSRLTPSVDDRLADTSGSPLDLRTTKGGSDGAQPSAKAQQGQQQQQQHIQTGLKLPAWVFCTRYSDRPTAGPRQKRSSSASKGAKISPPQSASTGKKRPRTAFSKEQLQRLKEEFCDNRYLTSGRRARLASELGLEDNQVKIWFQNKRAKLKKVSGEAGESPLARQLKAQGLYRHSKDEGAAGDDD